MSDDIVLSYQNSLLRKSDTDLLVGRNWLNDSLIGFWFEYLENKCEGSACFVSPEVAQFIKLAPAESKLFVEPLNLRSKDLIFLPVNDSTSYDCPGGSHWSLLVFDNKTEQFHHYDSMDDGSNFCQASKTAKNLSLTAKDVVQVKCTQQMNSWDCGVFVCCHAQHIMKHCSLNNNKDLKSLPLLSQTVADQQRSNMQKIIAELSAQGIYSC